MVFSPKGFKDILPIYINRKMDIDIRERLEEEMTKCNSLRLYKSRVRKINNIFPDEVVENILSFTSCRCKKCVKTRKVIENEHMIVKVMRDKWNGFDIEEKMFSKEYDEYLQDGLRMWLYYFVKLNSFPNVKTIQKRVDFNKLGCYNLIKSFYSNVFLVEGRITTMHRELKEAFENSVIFMLNTRGCQFYPEIFDGEFQREVMRFVFG